jgi:predicted HNH restriction endonuclease
MAYNGPATRVRTDVAIRWFSTNAKGNNGVIPPYTNAELLKAFGGHNMAYEGRQCGKVVSRLDFICYKLGFPPIGLIADEKFKKAWRSEDSGFEFPIDQMREAARSRIWTQTDFDSMMELSDQLRLDATWLWQTELSEQNSKVKSWAYGLRGTITTTAKKTLNPAWSRDELILALHLYMKYRPQLPPKHGKEIAELSRVLNRLAGLSNRGATFRNANGVYMKVMNFLSVDPDYVAQGKKGLQRNNQDEQRVWNLFAYDQERLEEVASQILAFVESDEVLQPTEDGDGYVEAEEGALVTRVHKTRERDVKLIREFKKMVKERTGSLICVGCDFESADMYGPEYADTMEAHHTIPVHTLKPGDKTNLKDLAILCANCHRIVHARKKWLTIPQLQQLVASRSRN